jgi:hypothetical protein
MPSLAAAGAPRDIDPVLREGKSTMPSRRMCCWQGYEPTYEGDQPANWRHLLVFWSPRPVRAFADIPDATWDRDGVLCPQHAAELEAVLKFVGPEATGAA